MTIWSSVNIDQNQEWSRRRKTRVGGWRAGGRELDASVCINWRLVVDWRLSPAVADSCRCQSWATFLLIVAQRPAQARKRQLLTSSRKWQCNGAFTSAKRNVVMTKHDCKKRKRTPLVNCVERMKNLCNISEWKIYFVLIKTLFWCYMNLLEMFRRTWEWETFNNPAHFRIRTFPTI